MKSVNVYLLRHGKTQGESALNGQTDVLVDSDRQHQIVEKLLRRGIRFDHIYSSHLRRCLDLAERLKQQLPGTSLQVNSALSEMNFGDYDGRVFNSLDPQEWAVLEQFWHDPANVHLPHGEQLSQFYMRCVRAWQQIIEQLEQDTLIIAHGGTIRMILAYLLDVDWMNPRWMTHLSIENQSLTHIQVMLGDGGPHFVVKSIGAKL